MPRSFGVLPKSTLNSIQSNNSKSVGFTLPEASHFSSRRAAEDFDRTVNDDNIIDECFGFDIGDEEEAETPNTESEQTSNNTKPEIGGLSEIRSKLKRFLHNPEKFDETVKKSKTNNNRAIRFKSPIKGPIKTPGKTPNKSASKTPNKTPAKTPKKTPVKTAKTPDKVKRNVFGETGAKQKDIRSAFATRSEKQPKAGSSKDDPAAALFEEIETVCANIIFNICFYTQTIAWILFRFKTGDEATANRKDNASDVFRLTPMSPKMSKTAMMRNMMVKRQSVPNVVKRLFWNQR